MLFSLSLSRRENGRRNENFIVASYGAFIEGGRRRAIIVVAINFHSIDTGIMGGATKAEGGTVGRRSFYSLPVTAVKRNYHCSRRRTIIFLEWVPRVNKRISVFDPPYLVHRGDYYYSTSTIPPFDKGSVYECCSKKSERVTLELLKRL